MGISINGGTIPQNRWRLLWKIPMYKMDYEHGLPPYWIHFEEYMYMIPSVTCFFKMPQNIHLNEGALKSKIYGYDSLQTIEL